jgi:hypothetical protein
MVDLVLEPPILVFGGPGSNQRALEALLRADDLGVLLRTTHYSLFALVHPACTSR